jgi:uncharacterized protein (TIGR02145 family)
MNIMKKFTIIIFFILAIVKTQSQDYLISFAGAGATTDVGFVKVDNLTSGATVTINGEDVLHLTPTIGINDPPTDNRTVQVYPNPMEEQSMLSFVAPECGNTVIGIVDLAGKTVYQISMFLSRGENSFRISGINRGMYLVKVTGPTYTYSKKLICQRSPNSGARIEYVSSVNGITVNQLKINVVTTDMKYTDGDQLLFKGISGQYSNLVADVPVSSKTITFNFVACTDSDGNNYATVQIGEGKAGVQTWMAENLKVGTMINGTQAQADNGIIEKYCSNNDAANCAIYGGLYQWGEMMQYATTPGAKGICPASWHLPTDEEWAALTDFLGGDGVAGGKMKSTGTIEAGSSLWHTPNTGATNESGFTALPGGGRDGNGSFGTLGWYGDWWSSTEGNTILAWDRYIDYDYSIVFRSNFQKSNGNSARCVWDF